MLYSIEINQLAYESQGIEISLDGAAVLNAMHKASASTGFQKNMINANGGSYFLFSYDWLVQELPILFPKLKINEGISETEKTLSIKRYAQANLKRASRYCQELIDAKLLIRYSENAVLGKTYFSFTELSDSLIIKGKSVSEYTKSVDKFVRPPRQICPTPKTNLSDPQDKFVHEPKTNLSDITYNNNLYQEPILINIDAQAQKIIFDLEEKEKEKDVFSAPPKSPKTVIVDVIDYLNLKCEKSYKHTTKKTQMLVLNILKDFSIEEIKEVIDFKSKEWKNDLNMNQYLRPETILGNKFESYLQSSKSIKNGKFNNDKGIIANSTTTNPRQRDYTAFKNQINDLCENGLRDRDGSKESVIDIEHEDLSIDQLFDRAFGIGAG